MQFSKFPDERRAFELHQIPWSEAIPPSLAIAFASGLLISQGGLLEGIIMEVFASAVSLLQYHNQISDQQQP